VFELVQLRQILEASCGYAMNFGFSKARGEIEKNKQA
jgi:hypothetical protein